MLGMESEQPGFQAQLRSLGVAQQGVGGRQGLGPFVTTERRQRFHPEQGQQAVDGRARIKVLWVDPADGRDPDQREQTRPVGLRGDQLRRSQPGQLITDRLVTRVDAEQGELAGGAVQNGDAVVMRPQADRDGVVGAATLEVRILDHRAGRQHPDHLPTNEAARVARRLHLVAKGDLQPGSEQLSDVALVRVIRHAGHRNAVPFAELA